LPSVAEQQFMEQFTSVNTPRFNFSPPHAKFTRMKASVFIVPTLDGFIARRDGGIELKYVAAGVIGASS
jgi:hypothetical protein